MRWLDIMSPYEFMIWLELDIDVWSGVIPHFCVNGIMRNINMRDPTVHGILESLKWKVKSIIHSFPTYALC
jgi:hypothetical protein